ncbi:hypothetical protein LIER_09472 [Lithospermum erythrorhizon]|uniref:DOG1 domain-containing protein n=1 Tax=Lithospermum erythrorhizon TaxID=34254 RepID=A0AAV3PFX0_LITER
MATPDQDKSCLCCFENWIIQQQQDLEKLLATLNSSNPSNEKLQSLVEKGIQHFKNYNEERAPSLFSPPWCGPFEKCFFWLGGCKPSLSIRLVYSLSWAEFDAQLTEFLNGERKGNLGEITVDQLSTINAFNCKIVEDEEQLSARIADLQDDIADIPFAKRSNEIGKTQQQVLDDKAMVAHMVVLAEILSGADQLRLKTIEELLMNILTPLQAVELLVATKRLHLTMHQWGKQTKGTSRTGSGRSAMLSSSGFGICSAVGSESVTTGCGHKHSDDQVSYFGVM